MPEGGPAMSTWWEWLKDGLPVVIIGIVAWVWNFGTKISAHMVRDEVMFADMKETLGRLEEKLDRMSER